MRAVRTVFLLALCVLPGAVTARCGDDDARIAFPVPGGWSVQPDTAVYGPENLWEYINGAADLFVLYGFEELRSATYRTPGGDDVRAELYRHATVADAYGMYSQERAPENRAVEVGTEGCADAGMLNIVFGRWYLKVSAPPAVGHEDLMQLARSFDRVFGSPRGLPSEFGMLPAEGRVPRSEQYVARDFLGYGFLSRAYLARYENGDGPQVFLIRTASPDAADRVRTSLLRVAGSTNAPEGPFATHVIDPHHGAMDIMVRGSDILGVFGYGKNETLRLKILKKLQ